MGHHITCTRNKLEKILLCDHGFITFAYIALLLNFLLPTKTVVKNSSLFKKKKRNQRQQYEAFNERYLR